MVCSRHLKRSLVSGLRSLVYPRAQALLEVTILASIFLFLLSVLLNFGVSMNQRQQLMMESFRHAVQRASSDDVGGQYLNYIGQYFKQIRVPDPSNPNGVSDLQEIVSGAQATRTYFLSNPWDASASRSGAPRMQYVMYNENNASTGANETGFVEVVNYLDNATLHDTRNNTKTISVPYVVSANDFVAVNGATNAQVFEALKNSYVLDSSGHIRSVVYNMRDNNDLSICGDRVRTRINDVLHKLISYSTAYSICTHLKSCAPTTADNPNYYGGPATGFVTAGVVYNLSLPQYTNLTSGQKRYALIARIPDPLDRYPTDNIYWSWVAYVRPGKISYYPDGESGLWFDTTDQGFLYLKDIHFKSGGPPDYDPPLLGSLETYGGLASQVSHMNVGSREVDYYIGDPPQMVFYQSNYDPAVPLDSDHVLPYIVSDGYPPQYYPQSASAIAHAIQMHKWIQVSPNEIFPTIQNQPVLSKGMEIYLNASSVAQQFCAQAGLPGEVANVTDLLNERMWHQGEYFTVQGLRDAGLAHSIPHDSDEVNDARIDQITHIDVSHSLFGDIDFSGYINRVKQGVTEYNLKTTVRQGVVKSQFTSGALRYNTSTNVNLTDTISRTIRTNPYGNLSLETGNNTTWVVNQTREVESGLMYNGTGWELNYE